jgi:hypothetical protein
VIIGLAAISVKRRAKPTRQFKASTGFTPREYRQATGYCLTKANMVFRVVLA